MQRAEMGQCLLAVFGQLNAALAGIAWMRDAVGQVLVPGPG